MFTLIWRPYATDTGPMKSTRVYRTTLLSQLEGDVWVEFVTWRITSYIGGEAASYNANIRLISFPGIWVSLRCLEKIINKSCLNICRNNNSSEFLVRNSTNINILGVINSNHVLRAGRTRRRKLVSNTFIGDLHHTIIN